MSHELAGRVHIRTPTYRRPDALRRALRSMIDQTWEDWVCDVFDDDPKQSARNVVDELADPRIRYTANSPQLFASRNIDQCFSARNPHDAEYFCVVEDDNYIAPSFCEANIALMKLQNVEIVLRNQLVEYASGTDEARVGSEGVLNYLYTEGRYDVDEFRLSLLAGIGVSNGGLFWSVRAISPLEIGYPCTATLQEYLRTYSVIEPVYVALEPLAYWAENAEQTTRNAGLSSGYLRRELDLKRAIQRLRQIVWKKASPQEQAAYLTNDQLAMPPSERAVSAGKSLLSITLTPQVSAVTAMRLRARGLLIRTVGHLPDGFAQFIASRDEVRRRGGH